MSYENRIKVIEDILKNLDKQIKDAAESNVTSLLEKRSAAFEDLRRLKRLQWEEQHERLNVDDDR